MKYKVLHTDVFLDWFESLKDRKTIQRISDRLDRVQNGNFGDCKSVASSLYELRFDFGAGYRIYFTKKEGTIILLLCGGDKSTQKADIKKAVSLLSEV